MSAPWALAACGMGSGVLAAVPDAFVTGPDPAGLCPGPSGARAGPGGRASTSVPARYRPESAYSTRVGIYCPRVVRTARTPDPHGVPPTLLRASGLVWLTDFDRLCLAEPATDLGSYLSQVDPELGQALLDGYRAGGGLQIGRAHV